MVDFGTDMKRLKELKEKYPKEARELDLVSGRRDEETGELTDKELDDMQAQMEQDVLEVIDLIRRQEHSGFSHGYMLGLLIPLLKDRPITKLTGNDWEWEEHNILDPDSPTTMNNRMHEILKDKKTGETYWIEGKAYSDDGGETFYIRGGGPSRTPIVFPCDTSKLQTEYIVLTPEEVEE